MKKNLLLFLLSVLCLILAAQEPASTNELLVGGDSDYPPYEFLNKSGKPDGYNVELSREIFRILGKEPIFRLGKWSLVTQWLQNSEVDVLQGMAFSMERAKSYSFSSPHILTWRAIFVRDDDPIYSETDLVDKEVVIQQSDVAREFLIEINFDGLLSEVPSQEIALRLLSDGDFDACVANYMLGMRFIKENNIRNIRVLPQRIYQREYCFASKDKELIEQINVALGQLRANGFMQRLQKKWFGDKMIPPGYQPFPKLYIGALAILLLIGFLMVYLYIRQRQRYKALSIEHSRLQEDLQVTKDEFMVWKEDFSQGPVVLYKCLQNPFKILDVSGNIDKWGFSTEELLANSPDGIKIIFSEDRERVMNATIAMQINEESLLHYRIQNSRGEICWVMDFCRLLHSPDTDQLCLYGYLIDITDQKRLEGQLLEAKEKAEAANISKSHFLASMSHEIRTPLNGITGFLQVLMQMEYLPQQREIYDIMYSSSRNLLKIINDILDFSKIESGKLELMPADFNLRFLLVDLVKQFDLQNHKPDLQISCKIDAEIPDIVWGDQLRLKQILINLMQNAIKFTEKGHIEILADIYYKSENEIRILLRVADTGIGIDPTKQQDIFDSYNQADSNISSKYGGTGLGLAIVKRLVELMRGFIWVESEPEKGSCFFTILPFRIHTESDSSSLSDTHYEIPKAPKLKGRVLLVEDDRINQLVTIRQLENWGLKTDLANNGLEALQKWEKHRYDAILMDIQTPVMDGISATEKIREKEQATGGHIPIIAFTAAALVGDRERFLASGMDAYIAKPIDIKELHEILSKSLGKATNNGDDVQ